MEKNNKTLTAAQRLEGLEQAFALTDQTIGNLTMNLQQSINALTLISKKLEAVVRIGNAGKQISSANVAEEISLMNEEELEQKVEDLKSKGVMEAGETIQENSFFVARELDPETKEVRNRRVQYPIFGFKKETKDQLLGKKPGDVFQLEAGRNLLEIVEVYNLIVPSAPAQSQAPAEASSGETAAAQESSEPSTEGSSS
jgi:hypothetical protein